LNKQELLHQIELEKVRFGGELSPKYRGLLSLFVLLIQLLMVCYLSQQIPPQQEICLWQEKETWQL
jgi:hypothetical protein